MTTAVSPSITMAQSLERIASTHSSRTAASSDFAGSTNAQSTESAMTDLLTPVYHPGVDDNGPEEELTDHEMEDMYAEADAARRKMSKMGTQSMGNLKKGKGRERSNTDTRPPPFVLASPTPVSSSQTITQKSAPPAKAKSGGSFSAFLRRLTGKGPKNKDKNVPALQSSSTKPSSAPTRPPVARQETAPGPSSYTAPTRLAAVRQNSMPTRPTVDTREPIRGPQPLSAPSRSSPLPSLVPEEVDPVNIPLPPSPDLSEGDLIDFTSPPLTFDRDARRARQAPMHSLEGFEIDELTDEKADEVRPLQPLSISTARQRDASPGRSLDTGSSVESTIQTPTSAASLSGYSPGGRSSSEGESSPEKNGMRLAGSSPPRKAPIGTGAGLERKESKWRKSVMGISDTVSRKNTTRPPPTSHDSYLAQQRRIASNRISCQPTLHSNASIAAGLTQIKSKEEADVAETFFLS